MKKRQFIDNKPISKEARIAFDNSYELLREQNDRKKIKPKVLFTPWVVSIGILTCVTFILIRTPIGLAISQILGFNKFESNLLAENNFISTQQAIATDQNISISFENLYADNNEVGIHLKAIFPKNHKLLNENLETPKLSFNLTTKDNENIMDFSNGKSWGNLNRSTGILDYFYVLNREDNYINLIEQLEDSQISIYRIGSLYQDQKSIKKSGMNQLKGEFVEGNWILNVDSSSLEHFESLEYKESTNSELPIHKFLITPTKIIIQFDVDSWESINFNFDQNNTKYSEPLLTAYKGDVKKVIPFESSSTFTSENNTSYLQLIFDFGGYESYDRFKLDIENQSPIEFTPN